VVPTWNYATVHAWGRPAIHEEPEWLRPQIEALTRHKEAARDEPWAVGDAPEDFLAAQIKGIVGVEIPIARIEGKWKMSQNRPEPDRRGVVAGYRAAGEAHADIAALVAARNGME
jgi:transcriptional regulator